MAALKNNSHLCHFRIANPDDTADSSVKGGLDRDLRKVTWLQVARLADRQSHLDASTLSYEPWSSSSLVVSPFIDLFSEVAEGEMCVDVLEFPVVCASTGSVDETPSDVEMRS